MDLFGEAFVGLGYNIDNDGGVLFDEEGQTPDTLRAISQVRFGVEMTGETDSGIVFGAEIWADDAEEGEGGQVGQVEGSVFVSGDWGTLTYGDADAADQYWVGDVPGNFSLTGLTDITDTKFISNGGSFGDDSGETFAENPFARPTMRYDFVSRSFGISVSTNRDLTDIAVGAGFSADLAGGSWSLGIGYYNFAAFVDLEEESLEPIDTDGDGEIDEVVPATPLGNLIPAGEQWSFGLAGEYERFSVGVTYTNVTSDSDDIRPRGSQRPASRGLRHLRRPLDRRLLRQGANCQGQPQPGDAGRRRRVRPYRAVRVGRGSFPQRWDRQFVSVEWLWLRRQ